MSRLRVSVGYLVGALVLVLARPRPDWLALAVTCVVLGEAVRVWASGHIEKTRSLAMGGPYAHTRNPLYVGSLLIAIGVSLISGHAAAVAAIAVYFVAFYPAVMREEELFLREKFENEYSEWARSVPLFIPRLTPGGPRTSRFSWSRVSMNREWRTVATIPIVVGLLYARAVLLP